MKNLFVKNVFTSVEIKASSLTIYSCYFFTLIIEASAQWESTNTSDNEGKSGKESDDTSRSSSFGHLFDGCSEAIFTGSTLIKTLLEVEET